MSGIINTAKNAAYEAANIIQQYARKKKDLKIVNKDGVNNFVTIADKNAEDKIIEIIKKTYPEHNILSEEIGYINNSDSHYTWIIDPLDGTTNFIHNHPNYCVSIAVKFKNKITHAVIFDFNKSDLYFAEYGKGAYVNDKRLRVSIVQQMSKALIGTGFPSYDLKKIEVYLSIFKEISLQSSGQRRSGSAALDLAYVAAGFLDGFWEFSLKPWDIAAGYLLIKEAGGITTDFNGEQDFLQSGNIIAGNHHVSDKLLNIISNYKDLMM